MVVVLFLFPYYVGPGTTGIMVQGLIVLTLASMWNLLAGYAGLVSVGQQAFFGLGAYFVLIPAMHGVTPWAGLFIAAIGAAVCALPLWWLVARLRLGYFAIATWVLASVVMLVIEQISSIGGGTGMPLPGLSGMDAAVLTAYTYWAALIVAVLAIGGGVLPAAVAGRPGADRDPRRRAGGAVLRRAGRPGADGRLHRRRRRVRRGRRGARHRAAAGGAGDVRRRVLACSGPLRWRSR